MILGIQSNQRRFREIVRGQIKKELRKYISRGEMIGRRGHDLISIPVPSIDLPHFRFDPHKMKGVGQGPGEEGTPVGVGDDSAAGPAGTAPGEHIAEVDVPLDELATLLGEELGLPRIRPKGSQLITTGTPRYTAIARAGPESLRHFKRTFRQALRRQIISGTYDPDNPRIVPITEDKRYRARREVRQPQTRAVLIYMMDVSGSMEDEQKEIVRIASFWIDTWLRKHYRGLESVYIIHDAEAHEVDQETFFHTRQSGGTVISSAYMLCNRILRSRFPAEDWNIYLFHFSDGDNCSNDDTHTCMDLLTNQLLPLANQFAYGQSESRSGSGQFLHALTFQYQADERVALSSIPGRDSIVDAIKIFLGRGR